MSRQKSLVVVITSALSLFAVILVTSVIGVSAEAMPARVLIIRHAEKPTSPGDANLSDRGQQRAQALAGLFTARPELLQFGAPVAIFAAAPQHQGGSMRPIETVTPLANSLQLSIGEQFSKDDFQAVASEIENNPLYDGKMVLVCWEHESIVDLLQSFGWQDGPSEWPHDAFDRIWEVDFTSAGASGFANLPQHLLPGDSSD